MRLAWPAQYNLKAASLRSISMNSTSSTMVNRPLVIVYQPQTADLSADGISSGLGWVMNCWFQKIVLATNKVVFEWNALDHVSPFSQHRRTQQHRILRHRFWTHSSLGLLPHHPRR